MNMLCLKYFMNFLVQELEVYQFTVFLGRLSMQNKQMKD
jgi:hypothetical protein